MPWGKYKGRRLDAIPSSYLQWVLAHLVGIDPDLRSALARELARRHDPGPGRRENYYRARAAAAANQLSLDEAEDLFINLLLRAEREGVFQGGAHLDGVWDLVAVAFEKFRPPPDRLSPWRVAQALAGRN
jgi:hypothetical protein